MITIGFLQIFMVTDGNAEMRGRTGSFGDGMCTTNFLFSTPYKVPDSVSPRLHGPHL